jgi:hypothetical protein
MSIPLDRLYSFIEHIAGKAVELRRFYPHGSKNIEDLSPIRIHSGYQRFISPLIFCYDQEPLDFNFYEQYKENIRPRDARFPGQLVPLPNNIYSKLCLLHSEKNSVEVEIAIQM